MKLRFIGDVHSEFEGYMSLLNCPYSIQLGDFGLGFGRDAYLKFKKGKVRHFFIRGNHDNPKICRTYPNFIPDGSFFKDFAGIKDLRLFALGGALSIDREYRIEGLTWFPDEEASILDLYRIIDLYNEHNPRVVVSHDCPSQVLGQFTKNIRDNPKYQSKTRQALTHMFESRQPELWVFGHYHEHIDVEVNGCRFICVDSLNYVDLKF